VDAGRFKRFRPRESGAHAIFAESGVKRAEDAAELAAGGWNGALVGTALMRSPDPRGLVGRMLRAGRKARVSQ